MTERTTKAIARLHPAVQPLARALVAAADDEGITIEVTSGLRTYKQQDELYAQGRTKPGKRVTNAKGGYSNHNFGLAFDVTIFEGRNPVWESPLYKIIGTLGKELGLSWGGDWKTFQDEPHFELRPYWADGMSEKEMLVALRNHVAAGIDVLA